MASREIILLRNDLPGGITHMACWSCPINDCSSLFLQHCLPFHSLTSCSSHFKFSNRRCSDFDSVSTVWWATIETPAARSSLVLNEVIHQPSCLDCLLLRNRQGSAMFRSPPAPESIVAATVLKILGAGRSRKGRMVSM